MTLDLGFVLKWSGRGNKKIYKTVTSPVLLRDSEIFGFLVPTKEHYLRTLNRVLVSVFDLRREKCQEESENSITRRLKICSLHKILAGNKIKKNEMSRTCSTSERTDIHSFSNLFYDKSKACSKASSPHSAI